MILIWLFLVLLSGISWTIVYVECVRLGIRDRICSMPFWALVLNVSWETLYLALDILNKHKSPEIVINIVVVACWILLDCGILYTYFRFGKEYFPKEYLGLFYVWSLFCLIVSFALQILFVIQFYPGKVYSAYLQNLFMSVAFIVMLAQMGSSRGQSKIIAYGKLIGTLAITILSGLLSKGFMQIQSIEFIVSPTGLIDIKHLQNFNQFILVVGTFILIFDIMYVVMLTNVQAKEKASLKHKITTTG